MNEEPCTSRAARQNPKKRKQPDKEDILLRKGPLGTEPIENEYEYEDLSDDASDEEGAPAKATHLKKDEINQIDTFSERASETQIDGIRITPFNLTEEKEEGQFDRAGNFIFRKYQDTDDRDDEEESDNWEESVDWDEVTRREAAQATAYTQSNDRRQNDQRVKAQMKSEEPLDKISCYKAMLRLMKPDEFVKKTIQRLGEGLPKRKPVNKNKRSQASVTTSDQSALEEMRRKLDLMIELAHQRLQDGDLDIYQRSYEDLEEAINC